MVSSWRPVCCAVACAPLYAVSVSFKSLTTIMGFILNYYILYTNGGEHPKLFTVSLHSTLCNIEHVKRLMAHFCPLIISVTSGQKWAKCIKFGFLLPQCSVSLHGFQDCIVSWHISLQNLKLTTVNLVDVLKQIHWIGGSQSVPVIC